MVPRVPYNEITRCLLLVFKLGKKNPSALFYGSLTIHYGLYIIIQL